MDPLKEFQSPGFGFKAVHSYLALKASRYSAHLPSCAQCPWHVCAANPGSCKRAAGAA